MNYWENLSLENLTEIVDGEVHAETWKDIPDFPHYQASTFGRIKSLRRIDSNNRLVRERILRQRVWNGGRYLYATLMQNKKEVLSAAHIFIAAAFIPNPDNLPQINHKNANGLDNRLLNLERCTGSYNTQYAYDVSGRVPTMFGKFGKDHNQSKKINQIGDGGEIVASFYGAHEAQRLTGIRQTSICNALKGRYQTAGGYKWEYAK